MFDFLFLKKYIPCLTVGEYLVSNIWFFSMTCKNLLIVLHQYQLTTCQLLICLLTFKKNNNKNSNVHTKSKYKRLERQETNKKS